MRWCYWPILTPGSAHSSSIGRTGLPPGTFAAFFHLNSGRTVRSPAAASIIAVAVYQARPAERRSDTQYVSYHEVFKLAAAGDEGGG